MNFFLTDTLHYNAITLVTGISRSRNHIATFTFGEAYLIEQHVRGRSRNCLIYVFLVR